MKSSLLSCTPDPYDSLTYERRTNQPFHLTEMISYSLSWWLRNAVLGLRKYFLPISWKNLITDSSLTGIRGVLDILLVQGTQSPDESCFPINILELWAIWLSIQPWTSLLEGHLIRIQSDKSKALAYINHQGRTRRLAAAGDI